MPLLSPGYCFRYLVLRFTTGGAVPVVAGTGGGDHEVEEAAVLGLEQQRKREGRFLVGIGRA